MEQPTLKSRWNTARKALTRPSGTAAALVVLVGLVGGAIALGSQLVTAVQPLSPSVGDLVVHESQTHSGRPWDALTQILMPYDTALPPIRPDAYPGCGTVEDDLLRTGIPLTTFDRLTFENSSSVENHSIQVLDVRVKELASQPAGEGVVVLCANNAGPNSEHATVIATNGALASNSNNRPLAFTLVQGEQLVVDLQIEPVTQDVTINLVADVVIQGKSYEHVINSKPIQVRSASASGPWYVIWGGERWLCGGRAELSIGGATPEDKCQSGTYSKVDTVPTVQNAMSSTWHGLDRQIVVSEDGTVTESIGNGSGVIIVQMTVESIAGPSVVDAIAMARVTSVVGDGNSRRPLPIVGDRVQIEIRNGVLNERGTDLRYCQALLDITCR